MTSEKRQPKSKLDLKALALKWQERWMKSGIFTTHDPIASKKEPYYCLEMFPYPSGYLHMGHVRNYSLGDVKARYERMRGKNVLYPMGYDSFGLPAENAAIQQGKDPREWTERNIEGIKRQQQLLGLSYDWSREIITSRPEYYKWNQWFFLKMLERGLAYKKKASVNWCPACNTVLANEQVIDGRCWRHEKVMVEQRELEQWYFRITRYADELLRDLEKLEHWPERVKAMQRHWIGRSEGAIIKFKVKGSGLTLETFTTRPDTAYGITYLAIAVEHPIVETLIKDLPEEKKAEIREFIARVKRESIIERTAEGKEKNGVFLGKYAINPLSGEEVPLWLADYALAEYGTGMVMGVPTHDQRDFAFAKKYGLPLRLVIAPTAYDLSVDRMSRAYTEDGILVNSGEFNGMPNREAIRAITEKLERLGAGGPSVNYKLRDWLISRQRYWGTPIPIIYCDDCGTVPVPEEELPVLLPEGADFQAGGNPLATVEGFVKTPCPRCGREARRETDTMDTFVDSSWYFLRFCDPRNEEAPFAKEVAERFMPVDQYIGGIEHAVLHLLYARFFTKVLRDMGLLSLDEPFTRLLTLGMVTKDGAKMSKSLGNVVDPGEIIEKYGPDTARLFILFAALPEKELEWSDQGVEASHRFLLRVARLFDPVEERPVTKLDAYVESRLHATIRVVTEEVERFRFNIALQHLMELVNLLSKYREQGVKKSVFDEALDALLRLLAPFAPHLAEELWERSGKEGFVSIAPWPVPDESRINEKVEYFVERLETLKRDVRTILELAGIKKPLRVILFLAPEWKYELIRRLKELLREEVGEEKVLNELLATSPREHGREVARIVPPVLKDRSKLPVILLSKEEEREQYASYLGDLEAEFGCPFVLEEASRSEEAKARQAMPGKPAILVS